MGMRPALCRVRKFTELEMKGSQRLGLGKYDRIHSINLLDSVYDDTLEHYPGACIEPWMLIEKFHKFIGRIVT